MAHSAWDQGKIWPDRRGNRADWKSQLDYEIQHWYFFKWLCGDHIVEQNIHNIDVINWFMGSAPARCALYRQVVESMPPLCSTSTFITRLRSPDALPVARRYVLLPDPQAVASRASPTHA